VLGYYPTNDKRDGRFRNVQVKVSQPGLRVRTRRGYAAPVPAKKENPTKGTGAEKTSAELADVLNSPIPVSGLTLSAFAAPFKGAAAKDAIALAIEVDASEMTFKPRADGRYGNDLEIALYAADEKGKIKDGARDVINVILRPTVKEMRSPFRVVRRIEVPPGKYQMRIGARESGGKTGTVVYDLDAPDFSKGPIAMSGIVLSTTSSGRIPTASPDPKVNEFKDVLPSPPSASRVFFRNDTMSVFAEVYDNLAQAAHRVIIKTSVLSDEGKVVFTTSDERKSEEIKGSAGGGYGHTAQIPLTSFAPGRYVLRLEAQPTLGNTAPIMREVEFRVQ